MPIKQISAAGTVIVSATPGVIDSIFACGTPFGAISIYDSAGTPPGTALTPVYAYTPATIADISLAKDIAIPCDSGIVVVSAAAGPITVIYDSKHGFPVERE